MEPENEKVIVLFDGVCNFCNATVNFILRHDSKDRFRFAALQSEGGKKILSENQMDTGGGDSVILFYRGRGYVRSSAALEICRHLSGAWNLFLIFLLVPRFLRDGVYRIFSKNRYNWFGKRETCMVPDEKTKGKFIGTTD